MQIGGYDILFKTHGTYPDVEAAVLNACKSQWPDMVVEYDSSQEFFVYEDQAAQDAWDNDVQNDNKMIYIMYDKNDCDLTLVVDNPKDDKVKGIIHALGDIFTPLLR